MNYAKHEIDTWLIEITEKLKLPLKSKLFCKKINDVQLGIQLYRSRQNQTFYFEFKIFNADVCSFGEVKRSNCPIFDQRLYQHQPIIGEKEPPDFWMEADDENKFDSLKSRLLDQGRSIFFHICSLEALLAYYRKERTYVYFDWKYNSSAAEMWAKKIEGFLNSGNSVSR